MRGTTDGRPYLDVDGDAPPSSHGPAEPQQLTWEHADRSSTVLPGTREDCRGGRTVGVYDAARDGPGCHADRLVVARPDRR